jgi:hypothetical protein
MKSQLLFTVLILLASISIKAQDVFSIRGVAIDTSVNVRMVNTTVSLLNAGDSTLYKFTRAVANGSFTINNLKAGKFILLVLTRIMWSILL